MVALSARGNVLRIAVRDGEADVVNCGPGTDTAILDFKDVIEDASPQNPNGSCEVVTRNQPQPSDDDVEDDNDSTT